MLRLSPSKLRLVPLGLACRAIYHPHTHSFTSQHLRSDYQSPCISCSAKSAATTHLETKPNRYDDPAPHTFPFPAHSIEALGTAVPPCCLQTPPSHPPSHPRELAHR